MNTRGILAFLMIVLSLVVGVDSAAAEIQQPTTGVIRADFWGTPYPYAPQIINSGTLTLTLEFVGNPEDIDQGWLFVQFEDGAIAYLKPNWEKLEPSLYRRSIADAGLNRIGVSNPNVSFTWEGYGPWELDPSGLGLVKKSPRTDIAIWITNPLYREWLGVGNPTWDWTFHAEPKWAAEQWPFWNELQLSLTTSCNGRAEYHNGQFAWTGVSEGNVFGNSVYRPWVKTPLYPLTWNATGPGGWKQSGIALGPECVEAVTYFLPNIVN